MSRLALPFALSLAALVAACGQPDAQAPQGGMPPPAAVTVETVKPSAVPVSFEYVGRLEASREVEIRPRVSAIIERRHFEEGAPVAAGALLYTLDAASLDAQVRAAEAEVANQQALNKEAQVEHARNQSLAAQGFVSQRALDATKAALDVTQAGVNAAQARLADVRISRNYAEIRAPLAGVMGRALQVEGALVSPSGPALTTLAQIKPIYARFSVGEDERLALQKQIEEGALQTGKQKIGLVLADGSRADATGKLNFSDYKANPETGAFDMRAEFANADGALKPGQFVRVVVEGGVLPDAVTVPQAAVLDGPTGKFVYVATPGEKGMTVALPHPVEVGAWTGGDPDRTNGRWVIRKGLKPGDRVIVDGTARIFFPGMPVAATETGAGPAKPAVPPAQAAAQ
ncbi:MAG: efflux RND transporter periplasmic adaptor subunit [Pseudomonadota bacterium]